MATFRQLKRGWQARVYKDGKQVSIGTYPTKRLAEKAAIAAEANLPRGTFVQPSRDTLGGFMDEWLKAIKVQVRQADEPP